MSYSNDAARIVFNYISAAVQCLINPSRGNLLKFTQATPLEAPAHFQQAHQHILAAVEELREMDEAANAPDAPAADEENHDADDEAEEEEELENVVADGALGVDHEGDDHEDDDHEDALDAEDLEDDGAQTGLRRNNTMIVGLFEDEYTPAPVDDEGIAFDDNENVHGNQNGPLPIAEIIRDKPYVKIGNLLLRAGSRKRDRAAFEDDDDNASLVAELDTADSDARPVKKYRRNVRSVEEKRLHQRHDQIEDPVYETMEVDLERLQSQQEPSDVRLEFLGSDGLDDAPTPPGSPRDIEVTEEDFDF